MSFPTISSIKSNNAQEHEQGAVQVGGWCVRARRRNALCACCLLRVACAVAEQVQAYSTGGGGVLFCCLSSGTMQPALPHALCALPPSSPLHTHCGMHICPVPPPPHPSPGLQGALYGARALASGCGPLVFAWLFKAFTSSQSELPYFPGTLR